MRKLGNTLIALGFLGLLAVVFMAYNPVAAKQQKAEASRVEASLPTVPSAPQKKQAKMVSDLPAVIRIPRLGGDWVKAVYEGVEGESLEKGIGHYPGTPFAGQEGNAGFAGHRSGWGNPLLDAENIKEGDTIQVKSQTGTWDYKVTSTRIVMPSEVGVLAEKKGKWLTLTTCWPKWGNEKRLVIQAKLTNAS